MNKAKLGARLLMGLIFTVFGLNGFLQFLPMPPMNAEAGAYFGALMSVKLIPIVKAIEVISGIALLTGYFVPLSLALLAPITFNILLFHSMLAPEGTPMGVVVFALNVFLVFANREKFAGLFSAK